MIMSVIGTQTITQVALIVHDIEKTKTKLSEFLGIPVPPTVGGGDFAVTQTQYMGRPAPYAKCLMAFFNLGNGMQIELIQPNEEPSVWRDFLNEKGEGLHHIAFGVKGMEGKIQAMEKFGMKLVQKGNYGDGGGCYSYLEGGEGLPMLVELLESF